MSKFLFATLAITLFFCNIQCKKEDDKESFTFEENKPFEVKPFSVYSLNGVIPLSISFKKVISDSRCPKDAICIWAGSADVQLYLNSMNNYRWDTLASMPHLARLDSTIFSNSQVQVSNAAD